MIIEASERTSLDQLLAFKLHKSNWIANHPNYIEIKEHLREPDLGNKERDRFIHLIHELEQALFTDFIRLNHADRSADYVLSTYQKDQRMVYSRTNLAEMLARLCVSHNQSAREITSTNGFRPDESIGPLKVNMAFIAIVLRLADILDLDRDRTPDVLFKTIHFASPVSLSEWEKHRSVDGWDISPDSIRFTMRCEHPVYQKSALIFMDWIDEELAECQNVLRSFRKEFSHYYLELPLLVDRSRIEPRNKSYVYHDLQFTMSRDEIVKLLMTEDLYGNPSLAIRELLQNSLDALRHRTAMIKSQGYGWQNGKVVFEHFLNDDGHETVRCSDNGVGMTEDVIINFLTNAGRSYYRSPEFEQERIRFRQANADFDPCAQFGIGFMSCFMLGDRIKIWTRRDLGIAHGAGEPIEVEISGLAGIVVIRKGSSEQEVGTVIEVVGRKPPALLDIWTDRVKLTTVIDGYARDLTPLEGPG